MSTRAWTSFAAVSVLWGIPYLFIKVAVEDGVPPAFLAWARVVLAALVLCALAWHRGLFASLRGRWRWVVFYAVVEISIPFPLIAAGEQHVSSSLAAILIAAVPLIVALLAIRFDPDERVRGSRLIGLLMGFGGVIALVGIDVAGHSDELLGAILILIAAVGYATGPMTLNRKMSDIEPVAMMGASLAVAAVVLTPFALADVPDATPSAEALGSVVVLGPPVHRGRLRPVRRPAARGRPRPRGGDHLRRPGRGRRPRRRRAGRAPRRRRRRRPAADPGRVVAVHRRPPAAGHGGVGAARAGAPGPGTVLGPAAPGAVGNRAARPRAVILSHPARGTHVSHYDVLMGRGRRRLLTCALGAVAALALAAPAAQARDQNVTSFDGTQIVTHFFPAKGLAPGAKAPTILVGHGWAGRGATDIDGGTGEGTQGQTAIGDLHRAGYNVLTWDARGFGGSGGTVSADGPDFEGRDVQSLITYRGQPARGPAGRRGRSAAGHGRRLLRRRHPARHRRAGQARRRDRARHRLAFAGDQPVQGREPEAGVGHRCWPARATPPAGWTAGSTRRSRRARPPARSARTSARGSPPAAPARRW